MSKAKQSSTAGRKIHRIANQTIIYGNSQSLREVEDDSVQLIVTSPPYWDLKKYGKKEDQIGAEDYETYIQRMNTVWEECYRVAADGGDGTREVGPHES
jgi:DNA modification methylase